MVAFLRAIGKWRSGNSFESSFWTNWSRVYGEGNKFEAGEMTLKIEQMEFVCLLPGLGLDCWACIKLDWDYFHLE